MTFEPQKRPQTQTDVVLPLTTAAALRSFNQTLLFDAAMKMLNLPTVVGIFDALQLGYLNVRTRPMLRRAVRGNVAKHFDQSVTFEPDHAPEQLANGQIYAAGEINSYNGISRTSIVRLNSDGTLDQSFNANEIYCSNINSFIVQPDGKLIVTDSTLSAAGSRLIVRLNQDGIVDSSFKSGFQIETSTRVNRLLVQPNGQILVGGIF